MKRITAGEATKDEIMLWFATDINGVAARACFERWLQKNRFEQIRKTYENVLDESQKEFKIYADMLRQAKDKSLDEKLKIMKKADIHYQKYEAWEAEAKKLEKKMDRWI